MADVKLSISDKQYLAKILFTKEKLDQKIIAKKVGVSEPTISKWVNEFNWKSLRNRLLVGKEEILNGLYEEMQEMQEFIKAKKTGERFSDSKMADAKLKITASIRNLETDLAIADLVESGIRFIKFLQQAGTIEDVVKFSDYWNGFLQQSMKSL
jgi:transposase